MLTHQADELLRPFLRLQTRTQVVAINALIAIVYLAAAKLGLSYAVVQANVTAVWPPAGIAIGAAFLWGPRVAPSIFFGALATNLSTGDLPLFGAFAIALGNTSEAMAAFLLARRVGFHGGPMNQPKHVWVFLALVALIATPISAIIGTVTLYLSGALAEGAAWAAFETWWLGDLTGALLFAPLVIAWSRPARASLPATERSNRMFEVGALGVLTVTVGFLVFSSAGGAERAPLAFFVLPVIVWATFRLGRRGAMLVIVALTAFAVHGAANALGPFSVGKLDASLLLLQAFVGVLTVTTLIMGALLRERANAERELQEGQLRLEERVNDRTLQVRLLLESTGEGIFGVDPDLRCTFANQSASQTLGWTADSLVGRDMHEVLQARREGGATYLREQSPIFRAFGQRQRVVSEGDVFMTCAGEMIPVQYSANPIIENGKPVGVAVVFRNVAEGRAMARKLDFLATHDSLTGLINRREFEQRVQRALASTQKNSVRHVLAYLDLDQFKVVNDNCGHAAGDELLRQLTVLLSGEMRPGDALARLGGDEFGVLMSQCLVEDAMPALERLCQAVREFRFVWEDKIFALGVSIGVTQIDTLTQNMGNALGEADAACYLAKDRGRNRIHVYHANDAELSKRHGEMQWVVRLQEALAKDRFFLACQVIKPVNENAHAKGAGVHYEILLRMRDEQGHTIPPGAFIPAAERYNLMAGIDRWVINSVLTWLESNQTSMPHVESWTINLSGQSFNDEGLLGYIREQLSSRNIPPASICFEITETAAVANLKGAAHFIGTLKQLAPQ